MRHSSLHIYFWWLLENLLNNYIIKTSEDKTDILSAIWNEKNNSAHNFDEKHILFMIMKSLGKRITFQPKNVFYRKLHYSVQESLSLLISKRVLHNFAEKLLATLICLWCALTRLCTVISRRLDVTKETVFWNCYWFCTDASMVGEKIKKISN